MAFEKPLLVHSLTAASALTASSAQYTFVKQLSNGQVVACAAVTDMPIGVLQNSPDANEQAEVMLVGITKVRVGGTDISGVSAAFLGIDSAGRAAILVPGTGASTTSYVLGRILHVEGSDNDGALVTAAVNCINITRCL